MASISDFKDLIDIHVEPWVKKGSSHDKLKEAAQIVLNGYKAQLEFLKQAVTVKKPDSDDKLVSLLAPTTAQLTAASDLHDTNDRSTTSQVTQTISEGITILSWVCVEKTPVPASKEIISAAMFYGNKAIMKFKGEDDTIVDYIKEFKAILEETVTYVKTHHTTGLQWGSSSADGAATATAPENSSALSGGNSLQAYDEFLRLLIPLVSSSQALSPELGSAAQALADTFSAQRAFLAAVENHSAPDDLIAALQPQVDRMEATGKAVKSIKNRDFDLHGKAIDEGTQLIAWVSMSPTTFVHVKDQSDSVLFVVNKIQMQQKGNDQHIAFVQAFKNLLAGLQDYVKNEHKAGLTWKVGGPKLQPSTVVSSTPPPSAAPASAVAPKPAVVSKPAAKKEPEAKKAGKFPTGEPSTKLEGVKWNVEYHTGTRLEQKQIEVEVEKSHSVYIYGCQYTFIKVIGKVNSLTVDKCKKLQIQIESCIGSIEITSAEGLELQVTGKLPSISIDKSSEVMLYLSRESIDTIINTSCCACVNVTVPGKTDDDDPVELYIPEQFVSKIEGNQITTVPMDHAD